MTSLTKTKIIIIIVVLIVLYAFICEYRDYSRIGRRSELSDITSEVDKNNELLFYGCFNFENNITWRSLFILSFISTLIIAYIMNQTNNDLSINLYLAILLVIFFTFLGGSTFKTFHLYRPMCSKIKPDNIIL